jgi:hypothetical protein
MSHCVRDGHTVMPPYAFGNGAHVPQPRRAATPARAFDGVRAQPRSGGARTGGRDAAGPRAVAGPGRGSGTRAGTE